MLTTCSDSSLRVVTRSNADGHQISVIERQRRQTKSVGSRVATLPTRLDHRSAQAKVQHFPRPGHDQSRVSGCSTPSVNLLLSSMSEDFQLGRMVFDRLETRLEVITKHYRNNVDYNGNHLKTYQLTDDHHQRALPSAGSNPPDHGWWLKIDRNDPKYRRFANILHHPRPIKQASRKQQEAALGWAFSPKKAASRQNREHFFR